MPVGTRACGGWGIVGSGPEVKCRVGQNDRWQLVPSRRSGGGCGDKIVFLLGPI